MDRTLYRRKAFPNEIDIVRKLSSNKTQLLDCISLRKYVLNTVLNDVRPEGNLQPDDEMVILQDDLYVTTWETNFGDFTAPASYTLCTSRRTRSCHWQQ